MFHVTVCMSHVVQTKEEPPERWCGLQEPPRRWEAHVQGRGRYCATVQYCLLQRWPQCVNAITLVRLDLDSSIALGHIFLVWGRYHHRLPAQSWHGGWKPRLAQTRHYKLVTWLSPSAQTQSGRAPRLSFLIQANICSRWQGWYGSVLVEMER